jgi:hypothetical protein
VRYVIIILLLAGSKVFAQNEAGRPQPTWLLGIKAMAGSTRIMDNSFSAPPYTGTSFGASCAIKYNKEKLLHELELGYTGGNLQTNSTPAFELDETYFTLDYVQLHDLRPAATAASFIYRAGGSINVLYAQRKYNRFINRDNTSELAASVSGALEITWLLTNTLTGFSMTGRVQAPLASWVRQPVFGNEHIPGHNNRLLSFNNFFRLKSTLILEKKLSGRSRLSLGYTWDYYQVHSSWQVKQARHQAACMYSFTL